MAVARPVDLVWCNGYRPMSIYTVADLGGQGSHAPQDARGRPFALMNYIVLQLQMT